MNRIITAVIVAVFGIVALPGVAQANYGTQVCVADPLDPQLIHTPRAIEDGDDTSDLAGMIVRPFPQNANGCASYNGTPLQEWETLYPGERNTALTAQQLASCKANASRLETLVTVVAGERDALKAVVAERDVELSVVKAKVSRQRTVIARLRAKLHAQR